MIRLLRSGALACALIFALAPALMPLAAFAQAAATVAQPATDTAVVTVPLGTWIASYASAAVEIATTIVMGLLTIAFRHLPAALVGVLKGLLTQQLVERGIAFGMNTVVGATRGKVLTFDARNPVLANALNYCVTNGWPWLVKWIGGPDAIRDHIIAMLPVAEGDSLGHATPTALGATTADPVRALGA